jgi:hypothetical protein
MQRSRRKKKRETNGNDDLPVRSHPMYPEKKNILLYMIANIGNI